MSHTPLYHYTFICVPVDKHLYCFQSLATQNKAVMNIFPPNPHLRIYLLILDWGRREGERNIYMRNNDRLLPVCALAGNQTRNLGMCPDWELNPQPFCVWDDVPTN